jgi:acyl-coenzyme A synthetase/AMP-(fatty) acid ligase
VRLLDPVNCDEVPPARKGMICILRATRASSCATGTCRGDREGEARGWFFTGDYARHDDDGYLWFLGRKDDIIKSFGYPRLSPYEVERVLKGHPAVRRLRVHRRGRGPDKRCVVAYVILHEGARPPRRRGCSHSGASTCRVQGAEGGYLARSFPRTRKGKILRREITPQIATARTTADASTSEPVAEVASSQLHAVARAESWVGVARPIDVRGPGARARGSRPNCS